MLAGGRAESCAPLGGEQVGADHQPPVGQFLEGDVLERDAAGDVAGGLGDGGQHVARAEGHLGLELLQRHPVAQPGGQLLPGDGVRDVLEHRCGERRAEVGGDAREPAAPAVVPHEAAATGAAQVAGDDLGTGLADEEAGAVIDLHEAAAERDPALGEEDEAAAFFEVVGHVA